MRFEESNASKSCNRLCSTPLSSDKVVLESCLSFAAAIHKLLVKNEACRLAGLYLFWNMVGGQALLKQSYQSENNFSI